MEQKIFGYARVSAKDQKLDRQIEELRKTGIHERDIFYDKVSGKDFDREEYQKLTRYMLREGDLMVVKSLDRLGRNYSQIRDEWRYITNEKKVDILILDMPILDTRGNRDLLGTLINDIILSLLSYVAENEREMIRKRQEEGIAIAKKKGVKFGRPQIRYPEEWDIWYAKWKRQEITAKEAMSQMGLKKDSFYRLVAKYNGQ